MILYLTDVVRELHKDWKACCRKQASAGERGWEWAPAVGHARELMIEASRLSVTLMDVAEFYRESIG